MTMANALMQSSGVTELQNVEIRVMKKVAVSFTVFLNIYAFCYCSLLFYLNLFSVLSSFIQAFKYSPKF